MGGMGRLVVGLSGSTCGGRLRRQRQVSPAAFAELGTGSFETALGYSELTWALNSGSAYTLHCSANS